MDCKTAQQKIMPYIQRELDDSELEEFIDHIYHCRTCAEELEVYFTIYYALEKLDQDEQGSYNIREMLKKDLERAQHHVRKQNMINFYRRSFLVLLSVLLVLVVYTGIQAAVTGSFEETFVFQLFGGEEETESENRNIPTPQNTAAEGETSAEPETNRKFQVIITTPETEKMTEITIDLTDDEPVTVPAVQADVP